MCGLIKQAQSHSLLRLLKQIVKGNFLSNQPGLDKGSAVSRQMEDRGLKAGGSEKSNQILLGSQQERSAGLSGATLFDEDESPVGKSASKGSKADSSLERLLNDEEEVPEPMPIAFMAAPETQATEE